MYAAGHPFLPSIEVETFCKNQPQHWRDAARVPFLQNLKKAHETNNLDLVKGLGIKNKEQVENLIRGYHIEDIDSVQTRLALHSSPLALQAMMKLIANRARVEDDKNRLLRWPELVISKTFDLPDNPGERWPELALAHSDCFACHHELQSPSWRQARGYNLRLAPDVTLAGRPGRVHVRPWSFALADFSLRHGGKAGDAAGIFKDFKGGMEALYAACNEQPFGTASKVGGAADELQKWSDKHLAALLQPAALSRAQKLQLMRDLCALPAAEFADYDTARQLVSVLTAIASEVEGLQKDPPEVMTVLGQLAKELNLRPYRKQAERLELLFNQFSKEDIKDSFKNNKALLLDLLKQNADQEYAKVIKEPNLAVLKDFMNALNANAGTKFTDILKKPAFVNSLVKIANEELADALTIIGNYDPREFKAKLNELAGKLPK
jgi:hypothetical protein